MNKLKTTFIDKGIPVMMGEYGMYQKNKTPEMVRLWMTSVCKAAYDLGICPMMWDIQADQNFYNRNTSQFNDPELVKELRAIAGMR